MRIIYWDNSLDVEFIFLDLYSNSCDIYLLGEIVGSIGEVEGNYLLWLGLWLVFIDFYFFIGMKM